MLSEIACASGWILLFIHMMIHSKSIDNIISINVYRYTLSKKIWKIEMIAIENFSKIVCDGMKIGIWMNERYWCSNTTLRQLLLLSLLLKEIEVGILDQKKSQCLCMPVCNGNDFKSPTDTHTHTLRFEGKRASRQYQLNERQLNHKCSSHRSWWCWWSICGAEKCLRDCIHLHFRPTSSSNKNINNGCNYEPCLTSQ